MRWSDQGRSRNLEDRRGGGGGIGKLGLGGVALLVVVALLTKQNPMALLEQSGGLAPMETTAPAPLEDPAEEREVRFVSFVLDTAQALWSDVLPAAGVRWQDARLVLFRDQVTSACGRASAASGPFYCPGDGQIYLDLGFYEELASRFGAPGEFARAYVLAHEIGHHVQTLLGLEDQLREAQRRRPDQANQYSVNFELQADCLAGLWAHSAARDGIVQPGDLEAGLAAAAAVGDDRIQRMSGGTVHPESWTHGSSAQRMASFRRGFDSGRLSACQ